MEHPPPSDREDRRLRRQIAAMERLVPQLRGPMHAILRGRLSYVRIPLGLLLIAGGSVGFLPVLGFWMIPLGLLVLAIDIPFLRPWVSAAVVRARRWLRRRRARGNGGA
ncbi:MAG: tryptophan synthase subunit beta [Rhodobacteraceae bacterium]|nr:tryptophan synthase subunit beta [Paracoccaceae bacterium]